VVAIRGILFDKDGTIIDYWRTWVPINRQAALYAAGGDQAIADQLLRLGGHDPKTDRIVPGTPLAAGDYLDIARAFAAHHGIAPAEELAPGIARVFREGGRGSALLPGVRETLAELKRRGFRLGIATNDTADGLEASLAGHDILRHFEFAAGCDSGYGAKPDPGMALAFCKAIGADPHEVALVGDAVHDLVMGRAAGAAVNIGVLSGTSAREDLAGYADVILDSINDMPARQEFLSSQGNGEWK
jgi:phosphoglycolate phosphatase